VRKGIFLIIFGLMLISCEFSFSEEISAPAQITKFIPINYIQIDRLRLYLSKMVPAGIKYEIDPNLKVLTVTDTPENIKLVEDIIADQDKRTQQIIIETKVTETKLSSTDKFGVNWTWSDMFGGTKKEIKASLENLASTQTRGSIEVGTLRLDNVNAVLDFLLSQTNTDLLTAPRILTEEGQEAEISTGERLPYQTSTPQGNILMKTTTYIDSGVNLRVKPFVKNDGYIEMSVDTSVNEIMRYEVFTVKSATDTTEDRLPVISKRQARTSVLVKDGDTLMMGGFLQNKTIITEDKIPLLGDIPFLGILFKRKSTEKVKTEIIIFITPRIVKEEKFVSPESAQ